MPYKKKRLSVQTIWDEPKGSLRDSFVTRFRRRWTKIWARHSGLSIFGRFASLAAIVTAPPFSAGKIMAYNSKGYFIAPSATVYHGDVLLGKNVYIQDRVLIFQNKDQNVKGGGIVLGDGVNIGRDAILETGQNGCIIIGNGTGVGLRCYVNAHLGSIKIGDRVLIGPGCAFYASDHETKANIPIRDQPLTSKGPIIIDDEVWLGFGVIVLSGVRIGKGAVVGAGSVVTKDIPANAIAVGNPARVIKMRE